MFYQNGVPIYETYNDGIDAEILNFGGEIWLWDNGMSAWILGELMLVDFEDDVDQDRFIYWTYRENLPVVG